LAAIAVPARYISGDTYDFISPSPSVCNIFIADIAGKGIPAAMMISSARALVRQSSEMGSLPSEILARVNGALYPDLESAELFLTAQLVLLEMGSGRLVYSSAGHTEAIIVRAARSCERLPTTAVPIGVVRDIEIKDEEARLKPGDFLVLYSDGVTEAADSDGELFGMERFEATLTKLSSAAADDIARAIVSEVRSFSGNTPLSDDLTIIVLKATPRIVHLREKAVLEKLDSIVGLVRRGTLAYGDDMAGMMELAASELVTNVIVHSYEGFADAEGQEPELDLYLRLESDRIVLDILDVGKPFDPESRDEAEPSPLGEGGRGLRIIRSMVDEMMYSPGGSAQNGAARRQEDLRADANHWRLVKYVKGEGA
jgi:anti-sigma regulatory factor (Ser/Thr protein kinase)